MHTHHYQHWQLYSVTACTLVFAYISPPHPTLSLPPLHHPPVPPSPSPPPYPSSLPLLPTSSYPSSYPPTFSHPPTEILCK